VIVASAWKQVAYNFLFFLAGLQAIPKSLLEAAAIDGARPMRRFWTIVFPLLSPTTFFLLVVGLVYAFFDTFGVINAVTQGGPANATEILVYKVYKDGIQNLDLGSSAAQSVVLMVIVIALTMIQFRFVEKRCTTTDAAAADDTPPDRARRHRTCAPGSTGCRTSSCGSASRSPPSRSTSRSSPRRSRRRTWCRRRCRSCPARTASNYRTRGAHPGHAGHLPVAAGVADDVEQPADGADHHLRQDRGVASCRPTRWCSSASRAAWWSSG
jgi:hypothetical protein